MFVIPQGFASVLWGEGCPPPPIPAGTLPAIILLAWLILQLAGLFTPPLLDDVDSVYIEVAREMLHRHDYVTPYIDGIRFFDKPPLMYWLAAGSMHLFGEHDYAARLPLALAFLALFSPSTPWASRFYGENAAPSTPPSSSQPPWDHGFTQDSSSPTFSSASG